jgi:hypothetical protein
LSNPSQRPKTIGKVISYDGLSGELKTADEESFIILEKDVKTKELQTDDDALFIPEPVKNKEKVLKFARFVEKITK